MTSFAEISNVLMGGVRANTSQEARWLASAPPEMQAQMRAQLEMQREQELMELIQKVMKGMSEASKTLKANIGA